MPVLDQEEYRGGQAGANQKGQGFDGHQFGDRHTQQPERKFSLDVIGVMGNDGKPQVVKRADRNPIGGDEQQRCEKACGQNQCVCPKAAQPGWIETLEEIQGQDYQGRHCPDRNVSGLEEESAGGQDPHAGQEDFLPGSEKNVQTANSQDLSEENVRLGEIPILVIDRIEGCEKKQARGEKGNQGILPDLFQDQKNRRGCDAHPEGLEQPDRPRAGIKKLNRQRVEIVDRRGLIIVAVAVKHLAGQDPVSTVGKDTAVDPEPLVAMVGLDLNHDVRQDKEQAKQNNDQGLAQLWVQDGWGCLSKVSLPDYTQDFSPAIGFPRNKTADRLFCRSPGVANDDLGWCCQNRPPHPTRSSPDR